MEKLNVMIQVQEDKLAYLENLADELVKEIQALNTLDLECYTIQYATSLEEVGQEFADMSGLRHSLYMNNAEEFFNYEDYAHSLILNYTIYFDEHKGMFIVL